MNEQDSIIHSKDQNHVSKLNDQPPTVYPKDKNYYIYSKDKSSIYDDLPTEIHDVNQHIENVDKYCAIFTRAGRLSQKYTKTRLK